MARIQGHSVSCNVEPYNSPFTQLCQIALIVGSAIEHTWNLPTNNLHLAKTSALIDELCNLISIVDTGILGKESVQLLRLLAPRCLVRSALFLVIDPYVCPEKMTGQPGYVFATGAKSVDELQLQNRCVGLLQEISKESHALAVQLVVLIETDPLVERQLARISPFSLDLLYCSLATFYWLSGEGGDVVYRQKIQDIELCLERLGVGWKLALEYLDLSRFYEVTVRSSLMETVNSIQV